jgi:hypothetical protein
MTSPIEERNVNMGDLIILMPGCNLELFREKRGH